MILSDLFEMATAITVEALSKAIIGVLAKWKKAKIIKTPNDVGSGKCYDFCEEVMDRLGLRNDYLHGSGPITICRTEDYWKEEWVASIPLLRRAKEPIPQDIPSRAFAELIGSATHEWMKFQGRYYDATAPQGVVHFLELPFFANQINGLRNELVSKKIEEADDEYQPPTLQKGDTVLVGKFKNRKAEIKGFTTDDNNQPVLKTTKGDQKLFKPRIPKLMEGKVYIVGIKTKVFENPSMTQIKELIKGTDLYLRGFVLNAKDAYFWDGYNNTHDEVLGQLYPEMYQPGTGRYPSELSTFTISQKEGFEYCDIGDYDPKRNRFVQNVCKKLGVPKLMEAAMVSDVEFQFFVKEIMEETGAFIEAQLYRNELIINYVESGERGSGYRSLKMLLDFADKHSMKTLLAVLHGAPRLIEYYTKLGFSVDGVTKRGFTKWFADYKKTWNIDDAEEVTMFRLPKTKHKTG